MQNRALQKIFDSQAIEYLLAAYCRALDSMDLDSIPEIFSEDCRVEFGPDPKLQTRGSGALALSLRRLWRWCRTSHHLSNVQIEFHNENSASVSSYVLAWHEAADGSTATVFGRYEDRVEKIDGCWKISRRRMLMNGNDAGFKLDLYPAQRKLPPDDWVAPDMTSSNRKSAN